MAPVDIAEGQSRARDASDGSTCLRLGLVRLMNRVRWAMRPRPGDGTVPAIPRGEGLYPDWKALLATNRELWSKAVAGSANGPRVLIGTYAGGYPQFTVLESALAAALTLRGAQVDVLLCDALMPGCLRAKPGDVSAADLAAYRLPQTICGSCMERGDLVFDPFRRTLRASDTVTSEDRLEAQSLATSVPATGIRAFRLNGWPAGEHAVAGTLRYFGRGDLSGEPQGETVARRYLEAAILVARGLERLVARRGYRVAVLNHGIYIPGGIAAAVCRDAGVRVAAWNLAYRKQCAIFSHDDTYHHTLMSEPVSAWEDMPWTAQHEASILEYLDSRRKGTRDWIWFNRDPDEDVDRFAAREGMDWQRPVIGMLTNVVWDAQLHYPANVFGNMVEWVLRTIEWFAKRPGLQLLIRVHPGELAPPGGQPFSRQPIEAEIARAFPRRPKNVFIVPPGSRLSTYAAMDRCDAVLIYGTKTGVELSSMGLPVIVAGEAWIRNKGLTVDPANADEYFRALEGLPLGRRMDEAQVQRARKYAYHFFMRRMIPLPFLKPMPGQPPYVVGLRSLEELMPGRHPGLDVICDGILEGAPFVYPAERLGIHDRCA